MHSEHDLGSRPSAIAALPRGEPVIATESIRVVPGNGRDRIGRQPGRRSTARRAPRRRVQAKSQERFRDEWITGVCLPVGRCSAFDASVRGRDGGSRCLARGIYGSGRPDGVGARGVMKPSVAVVAVGLATMAPRPSRAEPPAPSPRRRRLPRPHPSGRFPTTVGGPESGTPSATSHSGCLASSCRRCTWSPEYVVREPARGRRTRRRERGAAEEGLRLFHVGAAHSAGLAPVGLFEFDFNPSVGLYMFWHDGWPRTTTGASTPRRGPPTGTRS